MMTTSSRLMVMDGTGSMIAFKGTTTDAAVVSAGKFKLVISSTLGNSYWNTDGNPGIRVFTASLNPTDADYFAKVLNSNPDRFAEEQHYLYADFPVDDELATPVLVGVLSGSANTSAASGDTTLPFRKAFGAFDTRYKTPATTWFISQPFGATEYDLFKFEALDDGAYASSLYKIAISDLKASLDDSNPYGTFTVLVRDWNDTDTNPLVLEMFPMCSLDPNSDHYIGKLIGDRKVTFNFDATLDTERRVIATGKYPNMSKYVRVVINDNVDRKLVPPKTLPFGFRGARVLKTNDLLVDTIPTPASARLVGMGITNSITASLSGALMPPVPFRTKVTRGDMPLGATYLGVAGSTELVQSQYFWGVKFERNTLPLNPNLINDKNNLLESYTKFMGIEKLDTMVTGSGADTFNNNKFTLAKVAFANGALTDLTSSASDHMRTAAYIRNGRLESNYTIVDTGIGTRVTLATLLANGTANDFNRYSAYAKFITFMAGGWDGVNILDRNTSRQNDKASSLDSLGGASTGYLAPGLGYNPAGTGATNAAVVSYKTAVDIMTNPLVVNTNILAIPGIRESYITDYAMQKVRDYGLAYYVMDIASYDDATARLYDDSATRPNIDQTAGQLDGRAIDNNYTGIYYPDVVIDDLTNHRKIKVPASVAALGALAFNDRVAYPWFAPAGFNRAALDFVSNVGVRLNVLDRDRLYDSRINPIATFPRLGFVIYGQKTLQVAKSALDRVNVRRLLLEVKRIIMGIAQNMVFENNTVELRNKFVADAVQQLGMIQALAGVEEFKVIMNETNNTQSDIDLNRLNGKIIVVPTRVIEYIAIDFIVTNSGVTIL
jgi:hypothetical protein